MYLVQCNVSEVSGPGSETLFVRLPVVDRDNTYINIDYTGDVDLLQETFCMRRVTRNAPEFPTQVTSIQWRLKRNTKYAARKHDRINLHIKMLHPAKFQEKRTGRHQRAIVRSQKSTNGDGKTRLKNER